MEIWDGSMFLGQLRDGITGGSCCLAQSVSSLQPLNKIQVVHFFLLLSKCIRRAEDEEEIVAFGSCRRCCAVVTITVVFQQL